MIAGWLWRTKKTVMLLLMSRRLFLLSLLPHYFRHFSRFLRCQAIAFSNAMLRIHVSFFSGMTIFSTRVNWRNFKGHYVSQYQAYFTFNISIYDEISILYDTIPHAATNNMPPEVIMPRRNMPHHDSTTRIDVSLQWVLIYTYDWAYQRSYNRGHDVNKAGHWRYLPEFRFFTHNMLPQRRLKEEDGCYCR